MHMRNGKINVFKKLTSVRFEGKKILNINTKPSDSQFEGV